VTATSNVPGRSFNQNPIFPGTDPTNRINASEAVVDYDFFKTLDIRVAEGRLFMKENPADKEAFVINETAAKNLYPNGAIGKEITWERDGGTLKGSVIGVVHDFHFQSLHEPVRPLIFRLLPLYNYVLVNLHTQDFDKTIRAVETTWKKFDDRFGFEFSFLSNQLTNNMRGAKYGGRDDHFCLPRCHHCLRWLLGMAALAFRQKVKEVSVRKVLGATLPASPFFVKGFHPFDPDRHCAGGTFRRVANETVASEFRLPYYDQSFGFCRVGYFIDYRCMGDAQLSDIKNSARQSSGDVKIGIEQFKF